MKELKIVIADDSETIRTQLHRALNTIPGISLVGMAADGAEAIHMVRSLNPDLVVLDISMPHRNGIEVLKEVRSENLEVVIVMFTGDPTVVLRDACMEAGANYYLDKTQIALLMTICKEQVLAR